MFTLLKPWNHHRHDICGSNPSATSLSLATLCERLQHTLDTSNLIVATKRQLN